MQRRPSQVLFANIKEGLTRAEDLNFHERRMLIQYLRLEMDWTINRIAEVVKLHPRNVKRACKEMRESAGRVYGFYDTALIARKMLGHADELQERCRAKGNDSLEWRIERDKHVLMGRMGLINFKFDQPNQPTPQFNQQNNFFIGSNGQRPFRDMPEADLRGLIAATDYARANSVSGN